MLKNKVRIRRFTKGKKVLNSLLLKYETQLNLLKNTINKLLSKISILYSCLIKQNITIDNSLEVLFCPNNKSINNIRKWCLNYKNTLTVGTCINSENVFQNTIESFEVFNKSILKDYISFTPIWFNKNYINIQHISLNYIMHSDDLLYLYNNALWNYSVLSSYKEEFTERIKKYTTALDNCEEIIMEEKKKLSKIINNISTNEIIIQFSGRNIK